MKYLYKKIEFELLLVDHYRILKQLENIGNFQELTDKLDFLLINAITDLNLTEAEAKNIKTSPLFKLIKEHGNYDKLLYEAVKSMTSKQIRADIDYVAMMTGVDLDV